MEVVGVTVKINSVVSESSPIPVSFTISVITVDPWNSESGLI